MCNTCMEWGPSGGESKSCMGRLAKVVSTHLESFKKKKRKKDGKHRGEIAGGQRIALMMSMASKDSHC